MNEPTLDILTQRLDRMVGEIRLWKLFGSIVLGVLGILLLLGATPTKTTDEIRARRFVLIGKDDRVRALWTVDEPTENNLRFPAVLQFLDREGKAVVNVGVLTGRDGKERASLRVAETYINFGGVSIYGGEEGPVMLSPNGLSVGTSSYGASGVFLHARDAASTASLTARKDGVMLWLHGKGVSGISLSSFPDGSSDASFMKDGKVIWRAP